ncbi:BZ3500_MvSof-1268-A1-R1_Chr5-2g07904 [Microbotryum saponariae]|uniref:BZ3500_MvSof-1268-A1-R1_Chr5-2g07904 protein n=1 Tax=Microbotryum saponariae TaxID=289078 RepID=A0A2X0KMK5_9BASI|nr:BZ3500_MvSof-1268-A1-R1_Chr5-2g07904 [Microbotryum saponariae]SDA05773.1 BZ3501_MvSof-1269-A2-R1_Chr5-2g07726 [Microbotryum saponariae]
MPCIHCYISWVQSIAVYLPSLLAPLFLWLYYGGCHGAPPTYGPRYMPWFARGLLAAYRTLISFTSLLCRLSKHEDEFLVSLKRTYGPIVYLPWPLKQYFVLDPATVSKVYETSTSTLDFGPIRMTMLRSAFGGSTPIFRDVALWHGVLFPAHGRGLSRNRLEEPIDTFVSHLRDKLEQLAQRLDAETESSEGTEMGLVTWIRNTMFDAGLAAFFGTQLLDFDTSPKYGISSLEEFRKLFDEFDLAFPPVAGEVMPLPVLKMVSFIRKGVKARERLREFLGAWVRDGAPGLQEKGLVRGIVDSSKENGLTDFETGTTLNGTLWALQANGPFAAVWTILYVIQSPLYPKILQEIGQFLSSLGGAAPTQADLAPSTALPILSSAIHETLRLASSTSSLRDVQKEFLLRIEREDDYELTKEDKASPASSDYWIPQGSRIAAVTRIAHLDGQVWEDAKLWDGERFIDREGEVAGTRSKRTREVRAFGGGVSICEGRNLAYSELKAMVTETLSRFEITVLPKKNSTPMKTLRFIDGSTGIAPLPAPGRPGMGIFQFVGDVQVRVKRRVGTE